MPTNLLDCYKHDAPMLRPEITPRVMDPETDPFDTREVLTQVTLEKGELVQPQDHYLSMWNMYFIDRKWFHHEANGSKLARLFPAFVVLEFKDCPFSNPGPTLGALFKTHYLVLPIKHVGRPKGSKRSTALNVEFAGAKFNFGSTWRKKFSIHNYDVLIRAVCAYGYLQVPDANGMPLMWLTGETGHSSRTLGVVQHGTEVKPEEVPRKVLNVFQACEQALLLNAA